MTDPPSLVADGKRDRIAGASTGAALSGAACKPPPTNTMRAQFMAPAFSLQLIQHRLVPVPPRKPLSIGRRGCPVSGILSRRIPHYVLRRIAVDQRTQIKRMFHAAHLVLDGEQYFAAVRVNDVLEPVLMLIALLDN